MSNQVLWFAAAFVLMFEGVLPLLFPGLWREMFQKLSQMPEQHLRLYGAVSVVSGVLLYWVVFALYS